MTETAAGLRGRARIQCAHLAEAMRDRGFTASVAQSRTGVPVVTVANPEVRQLRDTVACIPDGARTGLCFAWGWGKHIGPAEDVASAVDEIARVLSVG